MSSALPLSLDQDLIDRLNKFLYGTGHLGPDAFPAFDRAALMRDVERLSKTNVLQADCLKVTIATLEGDDATVEDRIRNLELNRAFDIARAERVRFAANRLRGTEFLRYARDAVENPLPHPLHTVLPSMMTLGAFRPARDAIIVATKQQRVAKATPAFALAQEGSRVLDELGVADEDLARAVDVVGRVFWEHRLIWTGMGAEIRVSPPSSPPSLLIQYGVQITPEAAAELSWQIAAELVDVDLVLPGIGIALLGTELEVAAAA